MRFFWSGKIHMNQIHSPQVISNQKRMSEGITLFMHFWLLITSMLRIWFMRIFAGPKKTHEPRTRCTIPSFYKIFWPSYDKTDEMYLKQKIEGVVKIFQNLTNVKVGFGQNCKAEENERKGKRANDAANW